MMAVLEGTNLIHQKGLHSKEKSGTVVSQVKENMLLLFFYQNVKADLANVHKNKTQGCGTVHPPRVIARK